MTRNVLRLSDPASWSATRDRLHGLALVMGRVAAASSRPSRHWAHTALRTGLYGPLTGVLEAPHGRFQVGMDLHRHNIVFEIPGEDIVRWAIGKTGPRTLVEGLGPLLERLGAPPARIPDDVPGNAGVYDLSQAEAWRDTLFHVSRVFERFRGTIIGESTPVVLWPHHFDVGLLRLSGRLVPGQDPEDHDNADEQVNVGFSTGDSSIPEPYFYGTAYPRPGGLSAVSWPAGVEWFDSGWQGCVMRYAAWAKRADPESSLMEFLSVFHAAVARLRNG